MVVGISMLIGVPLGLIAGYYQGWLSEAIMRVTDVFLAVPQLILALALAQLMGPSLQSAMLALTLTYWPFFTRIVYAEARRLSASLFIDALQCIGARRPAHPVPAHPAQLHLAHHRARHHRHGLHDPGRGRAGLPRHGRHAARSGLGPRHLREPRTTCRMPGGSRPSRGSPSSSPCSASICWATACATSSIRG